MSGGLDWQRAQHIKGRWGRQTLSHWHTMGKHRPSHIPPELWKEYLRRYRRWAWWIGDIGGDHPDYPGFLSGSQRNSPTLSQSPSPGQSGSPSSSMSPQSDHCSSLLDSLAPPSQPTAPAPPPQPSLCANHLGGTQSAGGPSQGMYCSDVISRYVSSYHVFSYPSKR